MLEQFVSLPSSGEAAGGEALCRECAHRYGGCCRTERALAHLCFPLSLPEWRRIAPYARLAAPSFVDAGASPPDLPPLPSLDAAALPPPGGDLVCVQEENRPEFIASMHSLFKGRKQRINELFPAEGTHLAMRLREDGSCVFLGSYGCRLPRSARPWYCLLFPVWIMGRTLTLFSSPECLISRQARGPAQGVTLLGSDAATVRELHMRLQEDWGLR